MDLQLEGATAFISGSTQGIGYAIAKALLDEGASVIVNGRNEARVADTVDLLRHADPVGDVHGIAADFARPESVEALLGQLDHVDILVNNVGLFGLNPFAETSDAEWNRYFEVNVMSGVRLSRHLLDSMLARGRGRIIFVNSESGVNVPANMIHYGVTKAAMLGLGNGLAKLTTGTDVTVNSILGGPTFSDGVSAAVSHVAAQQGVATDAMKAAIIGANQTSLIQRFIEPSEIASLAVYLASPVSAAINGAALRADGGTLTGIL
ncbi:Short-chain dehydrogenase [Nocardioides exalbidus]|uniref:Short-chain dehydrogenase n=1 Tax=Nocardioides exalbidus TaxID=402596 RepID=A0A1H4QPQ6_9ACTN|nr:SDR family oxidoreductase [Nocardioides exalbidus]SEC21613.1 Short-chain dehydrogenase [Nocardioides exalbidus]